MGSDGENGYTRAIVVASTVLVEPPLFEGLATPTPFRRRIWSGHAALGCPGQPWRHSRLACTLADNRSGCSRYGTIQLGL